MAVLVDYGSSGEEDSSQEETSTRKAEHPETISFPSNSRNGTLPLTHTNGNGSLEQLPETVNQSGMLNESQNSLPLAGPIQGPTVPDSPIAGALNDSAALDDSVPQSPYSANRALLRDLTLPTVPNYDIPPSPPGSPIKSTNAKFSHFLDLKKQGVHFNEKLAKSSALKNPSLMQKLMDFADIDEAAQYATTLPGDLWNPDAFPGFSYKEELSKNQQKILKKKNDDKVRGQREAIDFVPAIVSGDSSLGGTPGAGPMARAGQKSAAERIMAGLDRGRSNSPQIQGVKRKTRFES